jgi:3-dehydroquinate synthase
MGRDKKAEAGQVRFVVLEALGRAAVRPAPDDVVARVVEDAAAL